MFYGITLMLVILFAIIDAVLASLVFGITIYDVIVDIYNSIQERRKKAKKK